VQIWFPAFGAGPTAKAHALPPQYRSGLWSFTGSVCLLVVWALWQLLCLCGHCKVGIGCSSCRFLSFPSLQHKGIATSPVSDRPSSQPVDLLAAVPYTPLFLLGIGFQLEPVRFPQAFLKWGLV